MKSSRNSRWVSLGLMVLLASGCVKQLNKTNATIAHTEQNIKIAQRQQTKAPIVKTDSGYYVDAKPISLKAKPRWLTQTVNIHAEHLPFQLLMSRLLANTPLTASYSSNIDANRTVTLHYQGRLQGALKALANSTDYAYQISNNVITWSAFETKTFDISFMPGTSNYLVGQQKNASRQAFATAAHTQTQLNNQQYSNLKANLSVWQDLKNTLNQLKSKQGRVIVSESTTSVTVQDHPNNVAAINRYIQKLNQSLTKQVAIKVQVLEVQLNKAFNYGVDWDLFTKALGTGWRITGRAGSYTNLVANNLINGGSGSATTTLGIGSNGTDAIINALSQQGKVRVVTEPEVVTLNDQIASIQITNNVGYIQSVSETQNENFSTTSINPGNVEDGFTLYVLPKIEKNKVFMQITSTIANLVKLNKESTQPTNDNSDTTHSDYQAIQVPTLSQKSFNQRSLIDSSSTLIVAGYKQLRDETSAAGLFGIPRMGGTGGTTNNVETLVLITPTILQTNQSHVDINTQ